MIDLRNLNRRGFGKLMSLAAAAGAVAVSEKPAAAEQPPLPSITTLSAQLTVTLSASSRYVRLDLPNSPHPLRDS